MDKHIILSMSEIATYMGPKGYSIKKEYISIEEQHQIRKELNVEYSEYQTKI